MAEQVGRLALLPSPNLPQSGHLQRTRSTVLANFSKDFTPACCAGLLGLTPAAPGFTAAHFYPNLVDFKWVWGPVPIPLGPIHVELEAEVRLAILELPEGTTVHVHDDAAALRACTSGACGGNPASCRNTRIS